MNRNNKALKTSYEIWNNYLSPYNNKLNLKILQYLLIHYFLFRYEEIAKDYHITVNKDDKVGTAIECFNTFINGIEKNMRNYEIVDVNLKDSEVNEKESSC